MPLQLVPREREKSFVVVHKKGNDMATNAIVQVHDTRVKVFKVSLKEKLPLSREPHLLVCRLKMRLSAQI